MDMGITYDAENINNGGNLNANNDDLLNNQKNFKNDLEYQQQQINDCS